MGSGIGEQYLLSNLIENREVKNSDGERQNEKTNKVENTPFDKNSSIDKNSEVLIEKYGINEFGKFGEQGKTCRVIKSTDPIQEADFFFDHISRGGKFEEMKGNPNGKMVTLGDSSFITYRVITSTKGSPAVEIVVSGSKIITAQKIHFIMEK